MCCVSRPSLMQRVLCPPVVSRRGVEGLGGHPTGVPTVERHPSRCLSAFVTERGLHYRSIGDSPFPPGHSPQAVPPHSPQAITPSAIPNADARADGCPPPFLFMSLRLY